MTTGTYDEYREDNDGRRWLIDYKTTLEQIRRTTAAIDEHLAEDTNGAEITD